MKNILLALLIACTGAVATAGMPVQKYQIGKVAFAETTGGINMSLPAGRELELEQAALAEVALNPEDFRKAGKHKVVAIYRGNDVTAGSRGKAKVKVVRKR